MSLSKILGVIIAFLVAVIVVLAWPEKEVAETEEKVIPKCSPKDPEACQEVSVSTTEPTDVCASPVVVEDKSLLAPLCDDSSLPKEVDRMAELFNPYPPTLPFVKTVTYASKVSWLTGRLAYLGDYAKHFKTSKHFISRSLLGKEEYFSEKVCLNDRFNVLNEELELEFHLVLDLSRLKLWFYAYDKESQTKTLLKTYPVSAGKLSSSSPSGSLTPTGVYALGKEIAVYKEGVVGHYKGVTKEMVTIFGSRWIPLSKEIANCTAPAKGLGLHGFPWKRDKETGELKEQRDRLGKYESLGCIHLLSEDISEIYAITATKPSFIHIVKDFSLANIASLEEKGV